MPAYSAITNAEIDPDSPITTGLMTKIRDNPIASHKYVRRTVNGPLVANSVVPVDDTVLEFAVDANQAYGFQIIIVFGGPGAAAANGVRCTLVVPAAAGIYATVWFSENDRALAGGECNASGGSIVAGGATHGAVLAAGGGSMLCQIHAIATVGANSGTVKLQYAQEVAGVNGCQSLPGSFLIYHRLDPI